MQVGKLSKAERQKRAPEADDQASQNSDGEEDDGAESSASENEAVDDGDLTVRRSARLIRPLSDASALRRAGIGDVRILR